MEWWDVLVFPFTSFVKADTTSAPSVFDPNSGWDVMF